jgi:hypothetical protein
VGLLSKLSEARESRKVEQANVESVRQIVAAAVADDLVTEDEEHALFKRLDELGWSFDDFSTKLPEAVVDAFHIARINDGRLPVDSEASFMRKKGEVVHLDAPASLTKEVIDRQFVGGSRGVSVPLGHGVRVRAGAFRGHTEVVGSHYEIADQGSLIVTSQRVVFVGQRKTVECRYDKLIDVQAYSDAVKLAVSNRQNASIFFVPRVPVVSAVISAAARRASG